MYTDSYDLRFYDDRRGGRPVDEFLARLPDKARRKAHSWLGLLKTQGHTLPRPFAAPLVDGVRELRVSFAHLEIRLLYFIVGNTIVVTQGFLKKTRRVPPEEIELCRKRRDDWAARREEEKH